MVGRGDSRELAVDGEVVLQQPVGVSRPEGRVGGRIEERKNVPQWASQPNLLEINKKRFLGSLFLVVLEKDVS